MRSDTVRSDTLTRLGTSLLATLAAALPAFAAETPAAHMMRMPGQAPRHEAAGTIEYFGGPVISKVQVEVVFWGASVAASTVKAVVPFYTALAGSSYFTILSQYATNLTGVNGHPGTNQTIGAGSTLGAVQISPRNTATTLSDGQIRAELRHQITIGKLPQQNPNLLYMIYFPANVTITLGTAVSCQAFGAYHEATPGKTTASNIIYGVMPDCGGGFNANLTVASSHEFAEAVSDVIPTPGTHPAYPQAWNTAGGAEIGDLCEGAPAATLTAGKTRYTVTAIFDKATNACSKVNFTGP